MTYFSASVLASLLIGITPTAIAATPTLMDCYHAAIQQSESIGSMTEWVIQAKEQDHQANTTMGPTLSGTASLFTQAAAGSGEVGSSISPATTPLVKVTIAQPLYRGNRESAAAKQAQLTVETQEFLKLQELSNLYSEVAQNFYTIQKIEAEIDDIATTIGLYRQRQIELNRRAKIGQTRANEVLAVDAAIAALGATQIQLQSDLASARSTFHFLTGFDPGTQIGHAFNQAKALLPTPNPLDTYLAHISIRPDIRAAQKSKDAAAQYVQIAKGTTLPSLDLSGNYYFVRNGVNQNVNWDVIVSGTTSFYNGDSLASKIKEAESNERDYSLRLQKAQRLAESEIRTLHSRLLLRIAQYRALDHARRISEKNYKIQLRDSQLGLVSNLDVMDSLAVFHKNTQAVDDTYFAVLMDYENLNIAAALVPPTEK